MSSIDATLQFEIIKLEFRLQSWLVQSSTMHSIIVLRSRCDWEGVGGGRRCEVVTCVKCVLRGVEMPSVPVA